MRAAKFPAWSLAIVAVWVSTAQAQQAASAEEAAAIAREATVWGYPLVVMDRTRRVHLNPPLAAAPPVAPNTFRHVGRLADHTNRTVVMPNNDTLYSLAWLKLGDGPVVLHLPAVPDGRYVSFQLLDAWTNTAGLCAPRTRPRHDLHRRRAGLAPRDRGWTHRRPGRARRSAGRRHSVA
jgi:hypothetical protein